MKDRLRSFTDSLTNSVKPALTAAQNSINTGLEGIVEVSNKTKESLSSGLAKSTEIVADSLEVISSNVGEKLSELTDNFQLPSMDRLSPSKQQLPEDGSKEELELVIEKLKEKDKVGLTGEILAPLGGAAAGVAASGAIAGVAGASTILGSTSLASALGGTLVATTPVGWVIGSAIALGAVGYGISKLIRSGADQDQIRKDLVKLFESRLQEHDSKGSLETSQNQVAELLADLVSRQIVNEQQAERSLALIECGKLSTEIALARFTALLEKSQHPTTQ